MGMDLNWLAMSRDELAIRSLKSYVNELFSRDESADDRDHRMCGYGMTIYKVDDVFVLTGEWRKCYGWDLGYWLHREGKDSLVDDVIFLEERQDEDEVVVYSSDTSDESYMLADTDVFGNPYVKGSHIQDDVYESYEDLWPFISEYFCGNGFNIGEVIE